MNKNYYKGKFIVFEGLDGSGQSTQVRLLKDFFINQGHSVISTKEPTLNSAAGKKIREVLDEKIKISPEELQQLFVEDRREHQQNLIIPSLEKNKIVISDRYFFSTFAYGAADGLDLEKLIEMNSGFLLPDLTFLLKVSPDICIERILKRGEGVKLFEKKEKLAKVWKVYEILLSRFENVNIIDGEKTIEEVFFEIEKIVLCHLNKIKKGESSYD